MKIYHIASRKAWCDATSGGSYKTPGLESEGFIHCSTAARILPVAREFYRGQTGLVLLVIDTARLTAEVKWERAIPPNGMAEGATFPHVYGEIGVDAVVQAVDFEPDGDGEFRLPPILPENDSIDRT